MNFISHLLASKGDRGSAEHPVAAGPFPAAHKNSSTTASPEPSPPPSPRFKSPPAAAAGAPPLPTAACGASISPRQPTVEDTRQPQQHGAPASAVPATNAGHDGEVEKLVKGLRAQLHALKKERAAQDARYVALASKHQEDKELHEASLDQLRQHMAHMNDSLALLREDRELLNRDVLVEREANKKLTEENDQLKIHQGELSKHHKELEDQLATMAASELTARNFAANTRSIEDAQTDAAFRQRFNLPATEFPIISYYCCHKHIYHGWLYITPAYMCFEPALLSKESSRITTPLTSITTLAKVRGFKYIPGTDNALIFKLKSGVEYFFNNFTHRDSVIANLVHQAAKFGHRIQSQDEKQIPDEGKEPKRASDGVVPPAGFGSLGQSKDTDSLPRLSSNSFEHGNVSLPRVSTQRARSLSDVG